MAVGTITVAGIEVPSVSPLFLAVVGFHVLLGAIAVIAGIAAMLSKDRREAPEVNGTEARMTTRLLLAQHRGDPS